MKAATGFCLFFILRSVILADGRLFNFVDIGIFLIAGLIGKVRQLFLRKIKPKPDYPLKTLAGISQSVRALIDRNARSGVEQGEYEREYQAMTERFAELENRLRNIEAECDRRKIQRSAMTGFLKTLKTAQAPIADFTSLLWNAMVEKAIVNADGSMVFTFRNGVEIRQNA